MREIRWFFVASLVSLLLGCGDTGGDKNTLKSPGGAEDPKACSDIFDSNIVPTFELTFAPSELEALKADCKTKAKTYRSATFKYGNETLSAQVRLKGNWSWRCEKMQFLVSFNETDPNGRFHGLRKIVLDAPWYDPSMLNERLGFDFMRRTGNYWSCVNHATLFINGEYYGAYVNVERLDKEYLQRHFPDTEADGNLYDGGVELKTNETVNDVSRRDALMKATDVPTIEKYVDLDEAVRMWAATAMLPDPDSYWAGVEINYYLYDHPTRGFLYFPYDMDMSFIAGVPVDSTSMLKIGEVSYLIDANPFTYTNKDWGKEYLFQKLMEDAHWCERFLDELKLARNAYDVTLMSNLLDTWATQIATFVSEDPNRLFSNQDHLDAIATMKSMLPKRLAFVNDWLKTATCPVTNWN
jgi:CotH kinase protein